MNLCICPHNSILSSDHKQNLVEWVLDSQAGRRLFELPKDTSDFEELKQIWEEGVAEKNHTPYLKNSIYRIV